MRRNSSRSLSRRRPSRMTSLAEVYMPLATFSLTSCSNSDVKETFTCSPPKSGGKILAHITRNNNIRYHLKRHHEISLKSDKYHFRIRGASVLFGSWGCYVKMARILGLSCDREGNASYRTMGEKKSAPDEF